MNEKQSIAPTIIDFQSLILFIITTPQSAPITYPTYEIELETNPREPKLSLANKDD